MYSWGPDLPTCVPANSGTCPLPCRMDVVLVDMALTLRCPASLSPGWLPPAKVLRCRAWRLGSGAAEGMGPGPGAGGAPFTASKMFLAHLRPPPNFPYSGCL